MKRSLILFSCFLLFCEVLTWAAEKGTKKISYSGTWMLVDSKTEQSSAASGLGGAGVGGGGGRRGSTTGGGGRNPGGGIPGGGNPGGGRRGGRGGEDPSEVVPPKDSSIIIEHSDVELKVIHKVADSEGREGEFVQIFRLDGSESVNRALPSGGELRTRTSWDKDKLVTLGTQEPPGSNDAARFIIVIKQEFALSKDGKKLMLKTNRTTPRGKISTVETFTRQAEAAK